MVIVSKIKVSLPAYTSIPSTFRKSGKHFNIGLLHVVTNFITFYSFHYTLSGMTGSLIIFLYLLFSSVNVNTFHNNESL